MQKGYIFVFLMTILTGCGSEAVDQHTSFPAKPNILFIAIDDLNDWLGCMKGHPNAQTPNIDRLAAKGTLFMNAHCQAPLCGPSRASVMTGLRPSTTGIYGQIDDHDIKPSNATTAGVTFLPNYFGAHGYHTMGVGKLFHHFAPKGVFELEGGREKGFGPKPEKRFHYDPAWFDKPSGTQTDWGPFPESDQQMPDFRTAQWATEQLKLSHDRPFFLAVGFLRPHVPWHVPQKWFDLFPLDSIQLPPYLQGDQSDVPRLSQELHDIPMMPTTEWAVETREWKNIIQAYLACIAFVDHYVGVVMKALEESSYSNNTIVVLWSDHGYHIGEKNRFAKHSLWEEATHVPLIISGAGIPGGQMVHQPVELLDLYPTLLDLCGLPANDQNEGHSLKQLLFKDDRNWTKPALTTYGKGHHAWRTKQYRLIDHRGLATEFYDHYKDPNEWKNLAKLDSYQSKMDSITSDIPQIPEADWAKPVKPGANDYLKKLQSQK